MNPINISFDCTTTPSRRVVHPERMLNAKFSNSFGYTSPSYVSDQEHLLEGFKKKALRRPPRGGRYAEAAAAGWKFKPSGSWIGGTEHA